MKRKSWLTILPLVFLMSGCSLLYPDPPSKICTEQSEPLSKEELIYRGIEYFYDDPYHLELDTEKAERISHYREPPALVHFANYKKKYLDTKPSASRREVIANYYDKFPDCCLLYGPPVHYRFDPLMRRDIAALRDKEDPSKILRIDDWAYDFILFPEMTSANSFKQQAQLAQQLIDAKLGDAPHPRNWDDPVLMLFRGMTACGVITFTSRESWINAY